LSHSPAPKLKIPFYIRVVKSVLEEILQIILSAIFILHFELVRFIIGIVQSLSEKSEWLKII
jgi:hypothetical protein